MNKCQRCNKPLITPNASYGWRCAQILGIDPLDPRVTGRIWQKIDTGVKKAESMIKNSPIQMTEKDKGDFYASFAKRSLWDGIDDFKVKEARKEGYSALNASKAKRTNIQKELEEYAKLHKDKNEEIRPSQTKSKDKKSSTLDNISTALSVASVIPGLDTLTNLAQIPVDIARGDYLGAVLDLLGTVPVVGELADTAKLGLAAGGAIKAAGSAVKLAGLAGTLGAIGKIDDVADTVKIADKAKDTAKTLKAVTEGVELADDIGDAAKTTGKVKNFADFPKNVHSGKQGKHIVGHNNYQKGKSVFSGTVEDAEQLVKEFAGKGQRINDTMERVDFKKIIGQYVDIETGKVYDTTVGTIRYSKSGVHIVPAKPKNWRK